MLHGVKLSCTIHKTATWLVRAQALAHMFGSPLWLWMDLAQTSPALSFPRTLRSLAAAPNFQRICVDDPLKGYTLTVELECFAHDVPWSLEFCHFLYIKLMASVAQKPFCHDKLLLQQWHCGFAGQDARPFKLIPFIAAGFNVARKPAEGILWQSQHHGVHHWRHLIVTNMKQICIERPLLFSNS